MPKTEIGEAIEALEAALKTSDLEDIEAKTQKLTEVSSSLAQKMYAKQAEAGGAADADAGSASAASDNDDAVDAEFEEVKDDK